MNNSEFSQHGEFATKKLQFSAYLHSSRRLTFLRSEVVVESGRPVVRFIFADPDRIGPDIEFTFENGDDDQVSAKSLFASQGFLRQQISRKIEGESRRELSHTRK